MTRRWLISFDPGFSNLRTALRGTLGVFAAFFVLAALAKHFSQPPTLAFLGGLVAMFGALIVNDATKRQRQITTLMLALPAVLGVVCSVALSGAPKIRLAAFFLVTFFAVLLRRFGVRWFALGFVGFMMFFMPLFFPMHVDSIPLAVVSVLVGTGIAYAFRFWIFPDRPQAMLKNYLEAFEIKLQNVLQAIGDGLASLAEENGETSRRAAGKKVQNALQDLNELILPIEQFVKMDSPLSKAEAESLQMYLFERELCARDTLEAARALALSPMASREVLLQAVNEIRAALSTMRGLSSARVTTPHPMEVLKRLHLALEKIVATPLPFDGTNVQEAAPEKTLRMEPAAGLHFTTKQAIQATLATALASLLGASVSSDRWYWASITAFVVFTGASRGDTAVRAFLRIIGTVAGLIAGFAVAQLVSGHGVTEVIFIGLAVFLALYNARRAFGFWSASLFSLMMALLFDLMGQMTTHILILRLEETVVGALIGALVSAIVLPTSTSATIRIALAKWLRTSAEILSELPLVPSRRRDLVMQLRRLDQDLLGIRTAAAPVIDIAGFWNRGPARETVLDASALTHLIRHLATDPEIAQTKEPESVRLICAGFANRLRSDAEALDRRETVSISAPSIKTNEENKLLLVFHRIEQVLISLERRINSK